eukprot:g4345.t1
MYIIQSILCIASIVVVVDAIDEHRVHKESVFGHSSKDSHFSGYLSVKGGTTFPSTKTFYYFVQHSDPEAPLLIWMNGGPGASSLAGLFTEIGPNLLNGKSVSENGTKFRTFSNPSSWSREASILVWDQPAGVGFSRCTEGVVECKWNDTSATEANYRFLKAFFDEYEDARSRDLYISGESYAGIYVPLLTQRVMTDEFMSKQLKGVAIGNGCIGYGVSGACGIDSLDLFVSVLEIGAPGVERERLSNVRDRCSNGLDRGLSPDQLSSSCRSEMNDLFREVAQYDQYSWGSACVPGEIGNWGDGSSFTCGASAALASFLAQREMQIALHVIEPNASKTQEWQTWDGDWTDYEIIVEDAQPAYREILDKNIPLLIYNGLRDTAVPWIGALRWIPRVVGTNASSSRRLWGCHDGDSFLKGGHVTTYKGGLLTFVTVEGAGHLVPSERPKLAFAMISSFLRGDAMPTYEGASCQRLWTGRGYAEFC